jgi:hypothetical protein
VQVDESFEPSEGAQLTPHLKVAKHVGSGTSADVYKLQSSDKQPELVGLLCVHGCCVAIMAHTVSIYYRAGTSCMSCRACCCKAASCDMRACGLQGVCSIARLQQATLCACPQVLKMAKAVPGLRRAFQREWMLGRRLNAVAAQAPELKMIIHTGDQQIVRH